MNWPHLITTIFMAFAASFIEFIEALTVALAVGMVRGWRSALKLFIDDNALTFGSLGWILISAFGLHYFSFSQTTTGILFFLGFAAILIYSIMQATE